MVRALSLLALVLAVALGLWLFSEKTTKDVQRVKSWEFAQNKEAPPAPVDWRQAQQYLGRLQELAEEPAPPPQELREVADKAAQWAAASRPESPEYRLATALRAACFALAQAGPDPTDPQRQRARSELKIARSVLAGESPGSVTHGIQDQLKNLQVEHGEQVQKALEEN